MRHEAPRRILLATAALAVPVNHARAQVGPLEQPFPAVLELSELDGQIGFRWNGDEDGFAGRGVAGVGDINGDGLDDVLIGVPDADVFGRVGAGVCYVIYGQEGSGAYPAAFALSDLDGVDGFMLAGGRAVGAAGTSVANAGDFNGDGVNDMIIGSPFASGGGHMVAGGAYVVFGRNPRWAFPPLVGLGDLDGFSGFYLEGFEYSGFAGDAVSSAGDINGDGLDDIAIGAYGSNEVYVVFGRPGFSHPPVISLDELDGTIGFRAVGEAFGDRCGSAVASVGDVNGDGLDDLAIGAWAASPRGLEEAGTTYIVFGRASGTPFPAELNLGRLDGINGFRVEGNSAGDQCGILVSSAGDINSDGLSDLVINSKVSTSMRSHIIFGRDTTTPFPATSQMIDLGPPFGFAVRCGSSRYSRCGPTARTGDVNGDGVEDILLGAPWAEVRGQENAGQVIAIFGRAADDLFPDEVRATELDGSTGFVLNGVLRNHLTGASLAGAGDMNGDGVDDFIIGAPGRHPVTNDDRGFVVFGRSTTGCPADLDADGRLTVFDFLTFQNLFDAGDPRADFDRDGDFTLFDFLAFQTAFDAGCP